MKSDALKERLKHVAKKKQVTFNEVWKQLVLERFLARLSRSKYQKKFVFKGGLLLAQYIAIGRETTDADFLMRKIKDESAPIERAMKEIMVSEVNDGFLFSWSKIRELTQPHMDYPGFRVSLEVRFEKMVDKIQLDIGIGDLVEPIEETFHPFEYKGKPIFDGGISLLVYPIETIFAEKLETIISKGVINSRMKDYHDVILMIREPSLLDVTKLKTSVLKTFDHRRTDLKIPVAFDDVIALQQLWNSHLHGLGGFQKRLNLPERITDVLGELNAWLVLNFNAE